MSRNLVDQIMHSFPYVGCSTQPHIVRDEVRGSLSQSWRENNLTIVTIFFVHFFQISFSDAAMLFIGKRKKKAILTYASTLDTQIHLKLISIYIVFPYLSQNDILLHCYAPFLQKSKSLPETVIGTAPTEISFSTTCRATFPDPLTIHLKHSARLSLK